MDHHRKITRRDTLKATAVLGGALMMSATPLSGQAAADTEASQDVTFDPLLAGVCDIHVHAAPDTKPRIASELDISRAARKAGYRAVMFKSNDWSCHDRAFLIREILPDFDVYGSLCMNRVHGDKVNVYAAEMAVKTTGHLCRCIWMPTLASTYQATLEGRSGQGIPVLDRQRRVLPEVVRVMEICRDADIIFATGHSSPDEVLILAQKAREVGVGKFVVTHANSLRWTLTADQIKRCVDLGAFIEHCFLTTLWGPGTGLPDFPRQSIEDFADLVRIAPERSFISTDLGQPGMPQPIDGMRRCVESLDRLGFSQSDIDRLVRMNPARLMSLEQDGI